MRRLVKNSVILSVGALLQRMLQIILLPIYTRFLGPADYGVISVLAVMALAVTTISTAGITNGVARYFFYAAQDGSSKDTIVWSGLWFTLGGSVLTGGAMIVGAAPISELLFGSDAQTYVVRLTGLYVVMFNVATYARTLLILEERMHASNVWLLAEVAVTVVTGLYLVVYLDRGVDGAIESQLLATTIPTLVYLRFTVLRYRPTFSGALLRKMLVYSVPLVGTVFAFWFIDSSDRYVLSHYLPLEQVGLYDMGYKYGTIILIVVGSFASAWPPYYHQSGRGQAVCEDVLKVSLLVTGACGVAVAVSAPLGLRILTGPGFDGAHTIVPMIVLSYVLKIPYLIFIMGIQMKNKTLWLVAIEAFAATLNLFGNVWLVPRYGREAGAVTTVVAYAVMALGTLIMVQKLDPIPGLTARPHLVSLGVTTVAMTGFMYAMMSGRSYPLAAAVTIGGFVVGMVVLFGVGEMRRAVQVVLRDPG